MYEAAKVEMWKGELGDELHDAQQPIRLVGHVNRNAHRAPDGSLVGRCGDFDAVLGLLALMTRGVDGAMVNASLSTLPGSSSSSRVGTCSY